MMRTLTRIVLFLLALALLAGLACVGSTFVAIPWLSGFTAQVMQDMPWTKLAFAIVVLVFFVATLAFVLFAVLFPRRRNFYTLKQGENQLEVSRGSIESGVGLSLQGIPEIKRYHAEVRGNPRPGKLKIAIQAEARDVAGFAALAGEIENRVKTDMENSLTIKPSHIKVKITPYKMEAAHGRQTGFAHPHSAPRVV